MIIQLELLTFREMATSTIKQLKSNKSKQQKNKKKTKQQKIPFIA